MRHLATTSPWPDRFLERRPLESLSSARPRGSHPRGPRLTCKRPRPEPRPCGSSGVHPPCTAEAGLYVLSKGNGGGRKKKWWGKGKIDLRSIRPTSGLPGPAGGLKLSHCPP